MTSMFSWISFIPVVILIGLVFIIVWKVFGKKGKEEEGEE